MTHAVNPIAELTRERELLQLARDSIDQALGALAHRLDALTSPAEPCDTASDARRSNPGTRGAYHVPPTNVRSVEGVKRECVTGYLCSFDRFVGSMSALVVAGLATSDMFPGQPGRGKTAVSYRPIGVRKGCGNSWWHILPGYMKISRRCDGDFVIVLNVPDREHQRRLRQSNQATSVASRLTAPDSRDATGRGHLRLVSRAVPR